MEPISEPRKDPSSAPSAPLPISDRRGSPRPYRSRTTGPAERLRSRGRELGPGLITGAADDDPSGIATYSQAGAAFGYGTLWIALVTLPLMASVQLMCARIGIVARSGLATVLREHYPRWLLWLACAMLLYANERLGPVMFASVVAICSKCVLRAPAERGTRHFLNPSNFGITATLLVFSWVSIAPPYQFTENMTGFGDWILPAVIVCTGTFLNARFTHRLPLIAAWLSGFVAQAALRSLFLDTPFGAGLIPMTGVAFILYTFYMVTDPATTPTRHRDQIIFGFSVAVVYGLLMVTHVVFGLFFALTIVCTLRGLGIYAMHWTRRPVTAPALTSTSAAAAMAREA